MDYKQLALEKHLEWRGKLEILCRAPAGTKDELSVAYTPGVAQPCLEIAKDLSKVYDYTRRWNTVAVITDGTAVLGLGDIGPEAGMPVMEGKCILFKTFGGVDAYPLCVRSKDPDEIADAIILMAGSWGGINLEDISAPRCFEIEKKLKEKCDIPIFHDDQHGTAVVTLAAITNAMKLVGKKPDEVAVAISGAGAGAISTTKLMLSAGYTDITLCNRKGVITRDVTYNAPHLDEIAAVTNPRRISGSLADAMRGADVFIGLSGPNIVSEDMVRSMKPDPIVFAMANPDPEILPDAAKRAGARIVATGRSDFANQINNVLAFPGILRGALDARASDINDEMKMAAAWSLAALITEDELREDYIIAAPFDPRVCEHMAAAVVQAAKDSGVARI